ncbi:hypothetical protein B0H17DRAFT_1155365, partial [Mycena rosella]
MGDPTENTKITEEQTSSLSGSPWPSSPTSGIEDFDNHSSNHGGSDSNSTNLSDLSEDLDDMPHFETENSLLKWLEVGREQLKRFVTKKKPEDKPACEPYFKTKIGVVPAERTLRLMRAEEKKTTKEHGKGLSQWFQPALSASKNQTESLGGRTETVDQSTRDVAMTAPDSATEPSRRPAMILEEVEDQEDKDAESLSPSEISRQEEDGFGDFEEIFAALEFDTPTYPEISPVAGPSRTPHIDPLPPSTSPSNAPEPDPRRRYIPGLPMSFSRADQSFRPAPVPKPAGPRSRPPPSHKVDLAIVKINTILHPSRGPNTKGFKEVEMNRVLRAQLELMISFLRLYASDGFT